MMNENLEWEFDFQVILETCGVQDEIIKKAIKTRSDSDIYFTEQFNTLKKLTDDWKQKNDNLYEIKLIQKRNLQKTNIITKNMVAKNKDITQLLQENANLNSKLNSLSDELAEKLHIMEKDLKTLVSKFEDLTLTELVKEAATNILLYKDIEKQLGENLKKVEMAFNDYEEYGKLNIPVINKKSSELENTQYLLRKIAGKEENIEFVTNEHKKNEMKLFV